MTNSIGNRIYLIGMMASGKSTIGLLLAKSLGYQFVDMDAEIESNSKQSISEIFANQGEEYFRVLESKLLQKLSKQENVVISTGGGAAIYHNGIDIMNSTGRVVWLKVSKNEIYNRLENDKIRPLANAISKSNLSKILHARNPIYKQAAIRVWNRGEKEAVVKRIVVKLLRV